jgi:hypothetical protein
MKGLLPIRVGANNVTFLTAVTRARARTRTNELYIYSVFFLTKLSIAMHHTDYDKWMYVNGVMVEWYERTNERTNELHAAVAFLRS